MTKTSIIIPTFNRPHYLGRILNYYDSFPERKDDFEIIVADSSSNENKKRNQEIISSLKNFKVLHPGDYPEKINPWYKFVDMMNYVKTKYSVLCADDDFVNPNGIIKSVCFLEKNSDFTVAHGRYFSFFLNFKKRSRRICWLAEQPSNSITFSDAQTRLKEHLSNYTSSTFYAVHRTEFLKMIFGETIKFTDNNRFSELLPSMLALIYGKMKCLDAFYAAREINLKSTSMTTKTIDDSIKEGSYDEEYGNFKNCLAVHLSKNFQVEMEEAKKIIDNAMAIYLKKGYPNDFKRFLRNILKGIFNYLNLPDSLYKKIKYLYIKKRLTFSKSKNNFLENIKDPSSKHYGDFNKIRNCVMSNLKIKKKWRD